MSQLPQVVEQCHQCLLWLIPAIDKLPRNRRFTLGEKLENAMLEVLALTTEASYHKQKIPLLQQANQKLAVARHLWRLCYELKLIDKRRYLFGCDMVVNIGRQIGGWRKQCSN
jgi:hypothetical protein